MPKQPEKPSNTQMKGKRILGPVALVFDSIESGSWRIFKPEVTFEQCSRCGTCRIYCPCEVIEIDKDKKTVECVTIDWTYCKGCGICADVCPKNCIHMIKEEGK